MGEAMPDGRDKQKRRKRDRTPVRLKVIPVPGDPLSPAEIEALEEELARLLVDAWVAQKGGE